MKLISVFLCVFIALIAVAANAAINYHYSETTAMRALEYAKISYCPSGDIASWSCAACPLHPNFQVLQVYDNASLESQAYSGYDPDTNRVVIAFRGSYNIPNWISDLDAVFTDYPLCSGCKVHQGFFEEWLSYSTPMLNDVSKLLGMYPSATIFVAGHSLGAAVAVHAATELAYKYGASMVEEYSFGTPRVGNPTFSMFVSNVTNLKTQRITHKADPVPHVPTMSMGYLHSPHETWYNNDGDSSFTYCNDYPGYEYPQCSDSIIPLGIMDHLLYLGRSTECNMN